MARYHSARDSTVPSDGGMHKNSISKGHRVIDETFVALPPDSVRVCAPAF